MGQVAKCEISIYFKEGVDVPLGITSETALQQSMLKYYYDTHPEADKEPHISIFDFVNHHNSEIDFVLYSNRVQNLDFQVDLLFNYLEGFDDIIEEITDDKWLQID